MNLLRPHINDKAQYHDNLEYRHRYYRRNGAGIDSTGTVPSFDRSSGSCWRCPSMAPSPWRCRPCGRAPPTMRRAAGRTLRRPVPSALTLESQRPPQVEHASLPRAHRVRCVLVPVPAPGPEKRYRALLLHLYGTVSRCSWRCPSIAPSPWRCRPCGGAPPIMRRGAGAPRAPRHPVQSASSLSGRRRPNTPPLQRTAFDARSCSSLSRHGGPLWASCCCWPSARRLSC